MKGTYGALFTTCQIAKSCETVLTKKGGDSFGQKGVGYEGKYQALLIIQITEYVEQSQLWLQDIVCIMY